MTASYFVTFLMLCYRQSGQSCPSDTLNSVIYCPELPDINGSHPITYFFKVDREIGDTVAMATISCPPQFRLLPAILNTSLPPESLPSEQTIHCDSHRNRWSSPIPVACLTIEEIAEAYLAAIPTTQPSTEAPPTSCCTSEEPAVVVPIDHQENPIVGPVNDSLMPSGSIGEYIKVSWLLLRFSGQRWGKCCPKADISQSVSQSCVSLQGRTQ
ncbi:unnamed protein product [Dibothriocephalus latus]|uniref:Sushi domain-containing protein n=1 Tax=Dibothriocephalus latus TaxID=60516 RepID=A0A3P7LJE7_DIBLA|nr:unnamed protein product [Dibothriocephalus latus]